MGGLPRRNDRVEHYKAKGHTLIVDAGSTLSAREASNPYEASTKAGGIAASWKLTGIDGVALSERDLALGLPLITSLVSEYELPVLAANLVCGEDRPFPAHRVVTRGDLRIGIVGVTSGEVDGCTVEPPAAAIQQAVLAMGEVDLRVGLVPMERRILRDLGPVPLDLMVLTTSGDRLDVGDTLPLSVISRGKQLGVATVQVVPGASGTWSSARVASLKDEIAAVQGRLMKAKIQREQSGEQQPNPQEAYLAKRLEKAHGAARAYGDGTGQHAVRVHEVDLDDKVADHAPTAALVQQTLRKLNEKSADTAPVSLEPRRAPSGPFLGADGCQSCHPAQTAQWKGTKHASAYKALIDDKHAMDSSCVGCHVTGWKVAGGPARPADVAGLRDVQCEACHGPSRAHAERPEVISPVRTPELATCVACHDGDRDGGRFDPLPYHDKIKH